MLLVQVFLMRNNNESTQTPVPIEMTKVACLDT